jgi:hypothetical protein
MKKKNKTPKEKRRILLSFLKKEIKTISESISLDPIDKGERKLKREIRLFMDNLKSKGKIEKFKIIINTIDDNSILSEIWIKFPKIDQYSTVGLKIHKKVNYAVH